MAPVSSSASSIDPSHRTRNRSPEVREKSKRPQLSCRKCRERKVKCDRVQPCSACSLHQIAPECTYDLTEQERKPILQAEALRSKEREILRLREELAARGGASVIPDHHSLTTSKHDRQQLSMMNLPSERLPYYDGSFEDPELMMGRSLCVTRGVADMTLRAKNPSGRVESQQGHRLRITTTAYPFPTLWTAGEGIAALYSELPGESDLSSYLESFERRAVGNTFPYPLKYCTRKGADKFLSQLELHAEQRPDVLALLFAALAQGVLYGVYDRHGPRPGKAVMVSEIQRAGSFMAAAFHALRISQFLSRPNLCTIETLTMLSQCLCDTGKFVDAWVLIGTTIRLAVLAKFHRNSSSADIDTVPEDMSRKAALWWWLLSLDSTSSMMCGRPLGASTTGDCPPAVATNDDPSVSSLNHTRNQITVLCRVILNKRRFTADSIRSLSSKLAQLLQSCSTYLPDDFNWSDMSTNLSPPSFCVQLASTCVLIYTLMILVHQQRQTTREEDTDSGHSVSYSTVLESARMILRIFRYVKYHIAPALQNWTFCQTAFNAAVLLVNGMGAASQFNPADAELVSSAHHTFSSLYQDGVHSLAGSAAARIHQLFYDKQEGNCSQGNVLTKDGIALIEGTELQDTLLNGYDFNSGDSDMSSPHEERQPLNASYPAGSPTNRDKSSKKTRSGHTTAAVSSTRPSSKRASKRDKETSKNRNSHGNTSSESHAMGQSGRQWSVSKNKHQQSNSRLGSVPQKPRSRGTGAAASQYINREMNGNVNDLTSQSSQYISNDMLNAFPNPPSSQVSTNISTAWEEFASQMMADTHSSQIQFIGNVPLNTSTGTTNLAPDMSNPANMGLQQPQQARQSQTQQQQQAANAAAQHVFTSSSHTYSQPQSPALYGSLFNPMLEQGIVQNQGQGQGQGQSHCQVTHDNSNAVTRQGLSQAQQPIYFPGGATDPGLFWGSDDFTGPQQYWGG